MIIFYSTTVVVAHGMHTCMSVYMHILCLVYMSAGSLRVIVDSAF